MARIVIITLANKPVLLRDAIESVKNQFRKCEHVWKIDDGSYRERGLYPPAAYYNEIAIQCDKDDYIAWLSDDDILYPCYAEFLGEHLDRFKCCGSVYGFSNHVIMQPDGTTRHYRTLPIDCIPRKYDNDHQPGGMIDGGQVMVRKSTLDAVGYPYTPQGIQADNRTNDAILINRIAAVAPMHGIKEYVMENRTTAQSAHTIPRGSGVTSADWRRNA